MLRRQILPFLCLCLVLAAPLCSGRRRALLEETSNATPEKSQEQKTQGQNGDNNDKKDANIDNGDKDRKDREQEQLRDASEYLTKYVSFPGAEECGAWAESYTSLHKHIRGGHAKDPRFLMFIGRDGFGDRLNGLITSFIVAMLTSRAFIISNQSIVALGFDPAQVDWTVPEHLLHRQELSSTESSLAESAENTWLATRSETQQEDAEAPAEALIRHWNNRDDAFPADSIVETFSTWNRVPLLRLSTNKGVLARLLGAGDSTVTGRVLKGMGLEKENAHACILRYLLRPKKEVLDAIPPKMVELGVPGQLPLGIHARFSDNKAWDGEGHRRSLKLDDGDSERFSQAVKCATQISDEQKSTAKWYLLSNMKAAISMALEAAISRPDRVVTSAIHPRHVAMDQDRGEAVRETVVDWLLYSLSETFIPSNSGFSKTALAYSLNRKRVLRTDLYLTDPYYGTYNSTQCDVANVLSLEELSTTWSGL